MSTREPIRWCGLAAMLAGALRTATSFWHPPEPGVAPEVLYLVLDLLILFGILGIYAFQSDRIGRLGLLGFVVAVSGTAIIAGPDGTIGPVDMYAAGSLCIGVGLVLLGVASWMARTLPMWIGIMWIVSTSAGILGTAMAVQTLFVVSGVAFGMAFGGAGAMVWRKAPAIS